MRNMFAWKFSKEGFHFWSDYVESLENIDNLKV